MKDRATSMRNEDNTQRSKPEEVTGHLITCFLQHMLNLCLVQNSTGAIAEMEAQPQIERKTADMSIADFIIIAEDDGGVCLGVYRVRWQNHEWPMNLAFGLE